MVSSPGSKRCSCGSSMARERRTKQLLGRLQSFSYDFVALVDGILYWIHPSVPALLVWNDPKIINQHRSSRPPLTDWSWAGQEWYCLLVSLSVDFVRWFDLGWFPQSSWSLRSPRCSLTVIVAENPRRWWHLFHSTMIVTTEKRSVEREGIELDKWPTDSDTSPVNAREVALLICTWISPFFKRTCISSICVRNALFHLSKRKEQISIHYKPARFLLSIQESITVRRSVWNRSTFSWFGSVHSSHLEGLQNSCKQNSEFKLKQYIGTYLLGSTDR